MEVVAPPVQTTRNGHLRTVFQEPLDGVVSFIDEHAPWLTPNHVTLAGTIGVIAIDYLIARYPQHAAKLSVAHSVFSAADALDGGLARRRAAANGTQTTASGALLDALSDKAQEFAVSAALASKAHQQDDRLGAAIQLLAGTSSSWPALFRARAEANGHIVPEGGLGTRPVRVATGVVNLLLSDRSHASQVIGLANLSQNLLTSAKRSRATNPESRYCIGTIDGPALIAASRQRYNLLKVTSAGTASLAAALSFRQNRDAATAALKVIAERTGYVVTPANVLDAVAFAVALKSAPKLNTTEGVLGIIASYLADLGDGLIARATDTTSAVGEVADAGGDKLKTLVTAYYVNKYRLAPRPLLAAVGLQNAANVAATAHDRRRNGKRRLQPTKIGKYGAFTNNLGIGLHMIGADLERTGHQAAAERTRRAATAITVGGLLAAGLPATIGYWRRARHES